MQKRSKDYNVIANAISNFSTETILSVYRKMADARAFENCIVRASSSGKFQIKIHMSSGQEGVAAALGETAWNYQIFAQHRSMDLYLAMEAPPEPMRDEILCLDTGTSRGRQGGTFQYFENGRRLYATTGFIGENISVGVGMALGNMEKTLCFFGDGAAEEDYALSAYGFAVTHHLPVLFVCTDNDFSVLSPTSKRRSWDLAEVARGFGMKAIDMSDDPFTLMKYVHEMEDQLPALINCRVCRNYWHAGVGIDAPPEWDRYQIVKEQIREIGLAEEIKQIDDYTLKRMEEVWKNYL